MSEVYDVIIIGGGAGGLSAGVYCARGKMKTLVLESSSNTGGQCAKTSELENYPGIVESTGPGLMNMFRAHCDKFGVEFQRAQVTGLALESDGFHKRVTTRDGETLLAKSVIIGTGANPRVLGIKGEREFTAKGVSYCATCDADFYEDLDIIVVGSGNTAVEESVFLTKFVNSVRMVVLHDEGILDADRTAQEQAYANDKISFIWNSCVDEICGDELVNGVKIKNLKTGEITDEACDGVFMFVGTVPMTDFLKDTIELSKGGYIVVDDKQETSMPGVYGAGDVCDKFLRQVVTAAGDGAVAAVAADRYVQEEEHWSESVLEAEKDVLVAFWSPVDPKSLELMPHLEKMAAENSLRLVTMDTYKSRNIADRYEVSQIPTVIRFSQGEPASRLDAPAADQLEKLV
ncbi:FAD-dependent oxidoreductase [Kistimonas asteriae]|uniref:FAD-dependent oxidoreductase n=1 Tax=Kistimonas asteriae TaxID=517724 RepID=UPI001BA80234|nr:FAD-dependent oxidoreductase [Kistimonas asteriae]